MKKMKKGMKRGVAAALAAGVLLAPATAAVPVAAASAADQGVQTVGSGPSGTAETGSASTVAPGTQVAAAEAAETADVRSLTLEETIERALEVDSNYKILEYTWRMLDLQEEDLDDKNLEVEELPDFPTDPADPTKPDLSGLEDWVKNVVWMLMRNPILDDDALEKAEDQLETAIDKLNSQKKATRLQQEEAREGVKMMVTQMYVGLLSLEQQLLLADVGLKQQEQAVQNAFLKYQLGLISMESQEQESRKLEDARRNADSLRIQYEKQLAQLLFFLDLPQDKEYQLAPVTPDPEQSVQPPEDLDELVDNSFKVRQAREALRQARLDYDFTEEHASNDDAGDRQVDSMEYQVKIAQEQLKQTEQNVRAQIDSLYRSAADAQAAYEMAQKKWMDASEDYQRMTLRYELGLIARQDLDNMDLAVRQAQVQLETTKYQYFLALAQLSALKAGYVPSTMG